MALRFARASRMASRVCGAPGTDVPIAFRAILAWDIRSVRRTRSSDMELGEGSSGAGEDIIGIDGEREVFWDGEGEDFMPFVRMGFLMGGVENAFPSGLDVIGIF